MRTVLWRRIDGNGFDRCTVSAGPDGHRITGTALFAADGVAHEIRYSVLTDAAWHTRTVGVSLSTSRGDRTLALSADGAGAWSAGDAPLIDLFGAIDVDLAWTPATNILPVKRLALEPGQTADISVVMLDHTDHEVHKANQRYECLAPGRYRFSAGSFATELLVDDEGLVTTYPGEWEAVAR